MGVVTTSGGACDLIADRATAEAIEIPPFAPETEAAITPHVPPFAAVRNPIDVTAPVNRITITWADGTATTVRPPAPAVPARPAKNKEASQ